MKFQHMSIIAIVIGHCISSITKTTKHVESLREINYFNLTKSFGFKSWICELNIWRKVFLHIIIISDLNKINSNKLKHSSSLKKMKGHQKTKYKSVNQKATYDKTKNKIVQTKEETKWPKNQEKCHMSIIQPWAQ